MTALPAVLLAYTAASATRDLLGVGLLGLLALGWVDGLVLWRRWRAWSAWSGEPICWQRGLWWSLHWLASGCLWGAIIRAVLTGQ